MVGLPQRVSKKYLFFLRYPKYKVNPLLFDKDYEIYTKKHAFYLLGHYLLRQIQSHSLMYRVRG